MVMSGIFHGQKINVASGGIHLSFLFICHWK